MIRKSGNRFSSGQTRSVCPEIMLLEKDTIMIRSSLIDHDRMIGEGQGTV